MRDKTLLWKMIKDAIINFNNSASCLQITKYIHEKTKNIKDSAIKTQIIICSVNHKERVRYAENKQPRIANTKYDFLYINDKEEVELYDSNKHGIWEIAKDDEGILYIKQKENCFKKNKKNEVNELEIKEKENINKKSINTKEIKDNKDDKNKEKQSVEKKDVCIHFKENGIKEDKCIKQEENITICSYIKNYIIANLDKINISGKVLELYIDENGNKGVYYNTEAGIIDILATDNDEHMVIFNIKLNKANDVILAETLRYMGWTKNNIAEDKKVLGVIVAKSIDKTLKYAVTQVPNISLFQYSLDINLNPIEI